MNIMLKGKKVTLAASLKSGCLSLIGSVFNRRYDVICKIFIPIYICVLALMCSPVSLAQSWQLVGPDSVGAPVSPESYSVVTDNYSQTKSQAMVTSLKSSPAVQASVSSACTMSAAPSTDPEVILDELVCALGGDVEAIERFMEEEIEFEITYGSRKGALGTLLDRSGNAFDRASLLKELFDRSGFSNVGFARKNVFFRNDDVIKKFLGFDTLDAAWYGLFGANNFNFRNPGNLVMEIPWVFYTDTNGVVQRSVPLGGRVNPSATIDPSISATVNMSELKAIDLDSVSAPSLIRQKLSEYSNNLSSHIKLNGKEELSALLPIHSQGDRAEILTSSIGFEDFTSTNPCTVNACTDKWHDMYRATIQIHSAQAGIDLEYKLDEVYGQNLSLEFNSSRQLQVYRGDTTSQSDTGSVSLASGSKVDLTVEITVPGWFDVNGQLTFDYSTTTEQVSIVEGGIYNLMLSLGHTGELHLKNARERTAQLSSADDRTRMRHQLYLNGISWLSQSTQINKIISSLSSTRFELSEVIGVSGYEPDSSGNEGAVYFDIDSLSATSSATDTPDFQAYDPFLAGSYNFCGFESSVIAQAQGAAVSPTYVVEEIMKRADGDIRVIRQNQYHLNNNDSILQTAGYEDEVRNKMSQLSSQGLALIVPTLNFGSTDIQLQDWNGGGYLAVLEAGAPGVGCTLLSDGVETNGGIGLEQETIDRIIDIVHDRRELDQTDVEVTTVDPIDAQTGYFVYGADDIQVGAGQFPYGLGFSRHYNSGNRLVDSGLGNGWTHNFDIQAREQSSPFLMLGTDSSLTTVPAIIANFVLLQLVDGEDRFNYAPLAAVVSNWFSDQLSNNSVQITVPQNNQTFVYVEGEGYVPSMDGVGSLTKVGGEFIYTTADNTKLEFNADGLIKGWTNRQGINVSFQYTDGKLQSVSNPFQRTLTFNYLGGDLIREVSDETGRSVSYGYNGAGDLTSYTNTRSHAINYDYDGHSQMTSIRYPENPSDNFVHNTYNALGQVVRQLNSYEEIFDYRYTGVWTEETNPEGNIYRWEFDQNNRLTKTVDQAGAATTYKRDGLGRVLETTFPRGNRIQYLDFDEGYRPQHIIAHPVPCSGTGCEEVSPIDSYFTYRPVDGQILTQTDNASNQSKYFYDTGPEGYLLRIEAPQESNGNILKTVFEDYSLCSLPRKITQPNGSWVINDYDPLTCEVENQTTPGLTISSTDDSITHFTYTDLGDLETIKDPEKQAETTFGYDSERNLYLVTGPQNQRTETIFDKENRPEKVEISSPEGLLVSEVKYTLSGKQDWILDVEGNLTNFEYDSLDRVSIITDPIGRKQKTEYDPVGRVHKVINAYGDVLKQDTRTHTYNENGQLSTLTDARNKTTKYFYDGHGRLTVTEFPDTKTVEQKKFNDLGLPEEIYTRAGGKISRTYDNLGRLKKETRPLSGEDGLEYVYNNLGQLESLRTKVDLGANTSSSMGYEYQYYDNGLLKQETRHSDDRVVAYSYDKAGRLTQLDYPGSDNFSLDYSYDLSGRPDRISEDDKVLVDYSHDRANRVEQTKLFALGTLNSASQTPDASQEFDWTKRGQLENLILTNSSRQHMVLQDYDPAGQLMRRIYTETDYAWQPETGKTVTSYGPVNNVNQYSSAGGSSIQHDDDNGNLTGWRGQNYEYDSINRLTKFTSDINSIWDYDYDPFNLRVRKTNGSDITDYILSSGHELAEYENDKLAKRYIYGPGADNVLMAIHYDVSENEASRFLYQSDSIGNVIAVLDNSGNEVEARAFSPFGLAGDTTNLNEHVFAFTGRRYDPESGLYYYRARYYSAELGQFTSFDPIGYGDQMNLYAYVYNAPTGFVDPLGLAGTASGNYSLYSVSGNTEFNGMIIRETRLIGVRSDLIRADIEARMQTFPPRIRVILSETVSGFQQFGLGSLFDEGMENNARPSGSFFEAASTTVTGEIPASSEFLRFRTEIQNGEMQFFGPVVAFWQITRTERIFVNPDTMQPVVPVHLRWQTQENNLVSPAIPGLGIE